MVVFKDSACLVTFQEEAAVKTRRNLVTVCSIGEKYAKWNCYAFINLKLVWQYLCRLIEQPFCVKKSLHSTVFC